jgi:UDP-N-acetylmuramyl pentapeptide phosphotransferase/UDP-N-acetylglucosamine-1-phosphate transferase
VEEVPELTSAGLVVAAAALGFVPFNFPAARTFLGDVGSYFFGAWLAVLAVWGVTSGIPPEAMLGPLALYLADTGTTLVRRIARGEEWMTPHRDHAYQRLVGLGWSHARVDALVFTVMALCSALGAASLFVDPPLRIAAGLALLASVGAYLTLPKVLAR